MRTVNDVISGTSAGSPAPLPAPAFEPFVRPTRGPGSAVGLAVPSMRNHTTDEGWQLFRGLQLGGEYLLAGFAAGRSDLVNLNCVHAPYVLEGMPNVDTILVQDKREWIGKTAGPGFDYRERFTGLSCLRDRPDVFRGTVLKDAHSDHLLHVDAASEIGVHFWVVYYDPRLVAAHAPFVRPEHLVRTWHSIDPAAVPEFVGANDRGDGLLSGALSKAYPLRSRLALACRNGQMQYVDHWPHPGYGRTRCYTPNYLRELAAYRVAVCTSSRYGYAVRKIVEATAAGCVVVTDLPTDEVLPEIDGNLIRIESDMAPGRVDALVGSLCQSWNADRQKVWAERAVRFYDFREQGRRLAADIEALRRRYGT